VNINIRKTLFWLHLILGCSAATFIFLMSLTGAALTYERQIIKAAERTDYKLSLNENKSYLAIEKLTETVTNFPSRDIPEIVLSKDIGAPITIMDGRKTLAHLDPYTGEEVAIPGKGTKLLFHKLRAFHRWLTFDGSFSTTGRWVNGIANVIFLVLILSGVYLWLPKRLNTRSLKKKLILSNNYKTTQARNYQWHNVFGFYTAPVLIVVVFTAVFFSFEWPVDKLKENVSSEMVLLPKLVRTPHILKSQQLSIDEQINTLKQHYPKWQSIRFAVNEFPSNVQIFHIDKGNGGEPQKSLSVAVDPITGNIIQEQTFNQLSNYEQVRSYIRFIHTGEVFGLMGQTLAGLASLLACLLVYTGILLSWVRWKNSQQQSIESVHFIRK
jgi:uncharacterized iron-regulated membrane protein